MVLLFGGKKSGDRSGAQARPRASSVHTAKPRDDKEGRKNESGAPPAARGQPDDMAPSNEQWLQKSAFGFWVVCKTLQNTMMTRRCQVTPRGGCLEFL